MEVVFNGRVQLVKLFNPKYTPAPEFKDVFDKIQALKKKGLEPQQKASEVYDPSKKVYVLDEKGNRVIKYAVAFCTPEERMESKECGWINVSKHTPLKDGKIQLNDPRLALRVRIIEDDESETHILRQMEFVSAETAEAGFLKK